MGYEQPQIFRLFQQTKQALQSVQATYGYNPYPGNPYPGNPYPGNPYPPIQQLRAAGLLDIAHYVFLGDRGSIYNQCIQFGRYNRIAAVRSLIVNGQEIGGGYGNIPLNQACSTIAQYAR